MKAALVSLAALGMFAFGAPLALAAAPFSDTFDTYDDGNLYSQGLWQNNQHAWNVTSDGCESGKCITPTGVNGSNWKAGQDLAAGEWHFDLYVAANPPRDDLGVYINFGSAEHPYESGLHVMSDGAATFKLVDGRSAVVGSGLTIGAWHRVAYRWNMNDPHNCTFEVVVDGVTASTTPNTGDPSNCYNNIYADHDIGSLTFSTYYAGMGQFRIDNIGDGPVVDGCMTNCDGTTSPEVSDDFDHFNDQGWQTLDQPNSSYRLGVFDDDSTGNCHSGGCVNMDGWVGGLGGGGYERYMYLETGVGASEGAYTIRAKAESGYSHVAANVGLCEARWSDCEAPNPYWWNDTVPDDGAWHQVYFAWRQGLSSVEGCILLDDIDPTHCSWSDTGLPLGTAFDGVALSASVGRPDLGEHVWLDELQPASQSVVPLCAGDCDDNVMFLPGIEASRLYRPDGSGAEAQLWEPDSDAAALQLAMNTDGTSVNGDIYTRDILDNAYVPDFGNVYKSFIDDMNGLVATGKINAWEPIPYDWRYSLDQILTSGTVIDDKGDISYSQATSSAYIIQELKRLAATSRTGKVTIVAHSNGGLVAKALMIKLGPDASKYIDRIILVDSPQVGTPDAVAAMLNGIRQGIAIPLLGEKLSATTSRQLGDGMPGIYNLLPSASYFTYVDDPVATFDATTMADWVNAYGNVIHSQEREHAFLADTPGIRQAPSADDLNDPSILNDSLLTDAEQVHAQLDTWIPPQGVKVIQIAGWGISTIDGVSYARDAVDHTLGTQIEIKPDAQFTIDGDGTVVVPSSLWISTTTGAEDYWFNLESYNHDHKWETAFGRHPFDHLNILETTNLLDFISDTITNSTSTALSYQYLSTEPPSSTEVRLRYALHSPLTLDFYDDQGRHTGISTSTGEVEEQIPGTYYTEFGDVKYVFTDTDTPVHIVMNGYATSTFTFDVEELRGDSEVASTTWQNMPVTPQTKVTLDIPSDITSLSDMNIDLNGDGVNEFDLAPVQNGVVPAPKYLFDGFARPINDTERDPTLQPSVFKAGSTVPVKFQLSDIYTGAIEQASSSPIWLAPVQGTPMSGGTAATTTNDTATPGNTYRWDDSDNQYIYNWSTKGLAPGYWYTIYAKLDDGTIYSTTVGLR